MSRLDGKVAIVTGSSSGIGKAIALRFGREGARVVVAARRLAHCEETVASIVRSGGEACAIQTDVSEESQVEALLAETVKRWGRVDLLVNNAGIGGGGRLADTTTKAFDEIINVNLRGTFFCCRAGFNRMRQQGGGVIINVSSVAGLQAWSGTGVYSASKHGVMALTKALADEGRPYGIKVSAICPGGVADELVDASPEEILRSEKIDPFDVAETALYLASLGPYATVHQIVIDRLGADW
ncbi:3-oxoacyl-(Acyl-carrier-protein) reductase [Nitrospira japonica]|uniref:3-oxoacyl-(Acyl-carrier-protein) reductase n=1 Tax=Nitrospira japonica TaxID=1325564 RepID=A0A1W1I7G6_9BACT|nr:SDR family oxidoreductase [Nitrospira japonica]SLM48956.1 3-oxoacyl-(Acyl-carrier-protein) reductase [Nitrospira japonica]